MFNDGIKNKVNEKIKCIYLFRDRPWENINSVQSILHFTSFFSIPFFVCIAHFHYRFLQARVKSLNASCGRNIEINKESHAKYSIKKTQSFS